jgi:DNA-binding transcriptional LysR family regulator
MAEFKGLQLVWLESFVQVAESRKRTAAAAEMELNQATITKHVQKLERWLGGKMLLDSSVPANLLPDGEKFLPVAKKILEMLDDARGPAAPSSTAPSVSAKDIRVPARNPAPKDG